MTRNFLSIDDFTAAELSACLALAQRGKRSRAFRAGALAGSTVALVFQKPSVRTRVSFEVAARQLGGGALYLGPDDAKLDQREPVKDVARTLSRYVQAIVARTFRHAQVEEFARYATVPVINGLSDLHHPCQALADLLTIKERVGRLQGIKIAYVGDGNNVLHSLAQGAVRLGASVRAATPAAYAPDAAIWRRARRHGAGSLELIRDPEKAARGADVLYTDVWTSMGQEAERAARQAAFKGFQINARLLQLASPRAIVMHCLPAHRGEEITDDALEGPRSAVFDQAENRLHAQKALLLMLLAKKGRS